MEDKLKTIFSDLFSRERSAIGNNLAMATDSSWDSLRHMQIIAALEENFPIRPFTIEEILAMNSFPQVVKIVSMKLDNKS